MSTLFRVDMQMVFMHGHARQRGHATRPARRIGRARPVYGIMAPPVVRFSVRSRSDLSSGGAITKGWRVS